jgi:exonuclease III
LVVVYIPSAGDKELLRLSYKVDRYWKAFERHCIATREKATAKGKGVIIAGDLNIAHQDGLDKHIPKVVGSWRDKQPGFTPA